MTNSGKMQISSGQLFCLLASARLASVVLDTSVSFLQFGAEAGVSLLLGSVSWALVRGGVRLQKGAAFYALSAAAVLVSAMDVLTFYRFCVTVGKSDVPVLAVFGTLAAFCLYAAGMGTQAVARFSAVALVVVTAFLLFGVQTNLAALRSDFFTAPQTAPLQLLPLIRCLDIPLLYLLLAPRTNGKSGATLLLGGAFSYGAFLVLILTCRAVLGAGCVLYQSPLFALFQLGKAGTFTKLDILYLCTVLVLLLTELSLAVSLLLINRKKGSQDENR